MIDYQTKIKVLGFDLDQTLYPKSPEIDEAIQSYLYKKISDHLGTSLHEGEKLFKDLYKEGKGLSGSKTMEKLGIPDPKDTVQEALEKADIAKFLNPDPKTISLLNDLKNKYKNLDLITGSARKITLNKLEKLAIPQEIFNHIITADEASKPDLTAYKMWMDFYPDFKPEELLYIGDRLSSDSEAPAKLGIPSILVNQKEIDSSPPVSQFKSFFDLSLLLL